MLAIDTLDSMIHDLRAQVVAPDPDDLPRDVDDAPEGLTRQPVLVGVDVSNDSQKGASDAEG